MLAKLYVSAQGRIRLTGPMSLIRLHICVFEPGSHPDLTHRSNNCITLEACFHAPMCTCWFCRLTKWHTHEDQCVSCCHWSLISVCHKQYPVGACGTHSAMLPTTATNSSNLCSLKGRITFSQALNIGLWIFRFHTTVVQPCGTRYRLCANNAHFKKKKKKEAPELVSKLPLNNYFTQHWKKNKVPRSSGGAHIWWGTTSIQAQGKFRSRSHSLCCCSCTIQWVATLTLNVG